MSWRVAPKNSRTESFFFSFLFSIPEGGIFGGTRGFLFLTLLTVKLVFFYAE